jgi:hypothetical protein
MLLKEALTEKLLDLRLRDRLLAEGKITQEQIDQFIANLPDDSTNMEEEGSAN